MASVKQKNAYIDQYKDRVHQYTEDTVDTGSICIFSLIKLALKKHYCDYVVN